MRFDGIKLLSETLRKIIEDGRVRTACLCWCRFDAFPIAFHSTAIRTARVAILVQKSLLRFLKIDFVLSASPYDPSGHNLGLKQSLSAASPCHVTTRSAYAIWIFKSIRTTSHDWTWHIISTLRCHCRDITFNLPPPIFLLENSSISHFSHSNEFLYKFNEFIAKCFLHLKRKRENSHRSAKIV